jgi:hypothetical protein
MVMSGHIIICLSTNPPSRADETNGGVVATSHCYIPDVGESGTL